MVVSTTRSLRPARSRCSWSRAGTSYTSWRHSRTVSRMIGNCGYFRATSSSWAERWRCCHRGVRLPGSARGSSRARAAFSRNREANSAEPPTSSVTICSSSSGSKRNSSAPGGSSSVAGTRSTMPSSAAWAEASRPQRSSSRARTASAHGPCTGVPNGLCSTTRQSPSSSRNRSTMSVRSSGTCSVASRCSARYASRLSWAHSSSPDPARRSRASAFAAPASSRVKRPTARPSSTGRPSPSPCQNGSLPGTPGAGATTTRLWVISSIRQLEAPSAMMSPTRDS